MDNLQKLRTRYPDLKVWKSPAGRWIVLDREGTPFWRATFETEWDAYDAWDSFRSCLVDAASNPDAFWDE